LIEKAVNAPAVGRCSALQPEGGGPIVDQTHLHVGPETASLHHRPTCPAGRHQGLETGPCGVRRCAGGEARPQPRARVGSEGELADQQQPAAGVAQAEVHPPSGIGEHPVSDQPFGQTFNAYRCVVGLHAGEHQQTGTDGGDPAHADIDMGAAHALEQGDHHGRLAGHAGSVKQGPAGG